MAALERGTRLRGQGWKWTRMNQLDHTSAQDRFNREGPEILRHMDEIKSKITSEIENIKRASAIFKDDLTMQEYMHLWREWSSSTKFDRVMFTCPLAGYPSFGPKCFDLPISIHVLSQVCHDPRVWQRLIALAKTRITEQISYIESQTAMNEMAMCARMTDYFDMPWADTLVYAVEDVGTEAFSTYFSSILTEEPPEYVSDDYPDQVHEFVEKYGFLSIPEARRVLYPPDEAGFSGAENDTTNASNTPHIIHSEFGEQGMDSWAISAETQLFGDGDEPIESHSMSNSDHVEEEDNETIVIDGYDRFHKAVHEHLRTDPDPSPRELALRLVESDSRLAEFCLTMPVKQLMSLISAELDCEKGEIEYRILDDIIQIPGFVRYHIVSPYQIIIVASDEMLAKGEETRWILVDGTFQITPKPFFQTLTLMGIDDETGVFYPIIHAFLPSKEASVYRAFFNLIDPLVRFRRVGLVTVDFEMALFNETGMWLARNDYVAALKGCKFHYAQALTKRMKAFHKKLSWTQICILKLFIAFANVPKHVVLHIINTLDCYEHGEKGFMKYFRGFWMRNFDHWNLSGVDESFKDCLTNNGLESYHSILSQKLPKSPTIARCCQVLHQTATRRLTEISHHQRRERVASSRPDVRELMWRLGELTESMQMKDVPSLQRKRGRPRKNPQ